MVKGGQQTSIEVVKDRILKSDRKRTTQNFEIYKVAAEENYFSIHKMKKCCFYEKNYYDS